MESPYEVHDYIRAYLGDTPEAKEFAKQFLERRAKQKANQQRQQQVHISYFCFGGIFPSSWAEKNASDRCGIVPKKESMFEHGCINIETIHLEAFLKTVCR